MKNNWFRLGVALAVAILALAPAVAAAQESAQDPHQDPAAAPMQEPTEDPGTAREEAETVLTGQLSEPEEGRYVLIEAESGDEIALQGGAELDEHVGHNVEVTGEWTTDAEGQEVFEVSSVEMAPSEPSA